MSTINDDLEFERAMAEKVTLQLVDALNKFSDTTGKQNNQELVDAVEEQTAEIKKFIGSVKLFKTNASLYEKDSISSLLNMNENLINKLELLSNSIKHPDKKNFLFTVNRNPTQGWIDTITAEQV